MYQDAVEARNLQQPGHAAVAEPFVVWHLRELGRHHVQRHPVCSRGDGGLRLHLLGSYPLQWPLLVQTAVGVLDRVAYVFPVDVDVPDAVSRAVVDSLQKDVHILRFYDFTICCLTLQIYHGLRVLVGTHGFSVKHFVVDINFRIFAAVKELSNGTMRKVKAIIERAGDGNYSVYMDADDLDYLVTGTGKTAEEAIQCFKNGYEDMKNYYAEEGKEFVEVEFEYEYDMASFLSYFSKAFSLAGLSRITGINQGQLSHYVTGHRIPSARTKEKMQESIHSFAKDLAEVNFI